MDYEDEVPTGVPGRQASSPELKQAARKGSARIDPNDVFYLTDRPLPAMSDETIRHVQSAPPPPVRPGSGPPGPMPPMPRPPSIPPPRLPSVPPAPRVPSFPPVNVPDPLTSTVAFPLANRKSNRPPGQAPSTSPAPKPEAIPEVPSGEPRKKRFPALPELRHAHLGPPVEDRWGNAAAVFLGGFVVMLLAAALFFLVIALNPGPARTGSDTPPTPATSR